MAFVFLILVFALLTALVLPLIDSRNRSVFKLGIRYGMNWRVETLVKAVPVALLISVVLSSLSVGDGLYTMVERNTERNLSDVDIIVEAPRFVREGLMDGMEGINTAPVIDTTVMLSTEGGRYRGARAFGIDNRIMELGSLETTDGSIVEGPPSRNGLIINSKLAGDLGIGTGDNLILEFSDDSLREDILISSSGSTTFRLNLTVETIVRNEGLGRFRDDALDKIPPLVFISLDRLQERMDKEGSVNTFLIDAWDEDVTDRIADWISSKLELDDIGFEISSTSSYDGFILRSDDFFFSGSVFERSGGIPSLTYFVDRLGSIPDSLAYSVVSGSDMELPGLGRSLESGEIVINNWTADALDLSVGDEINVQYRTLKGFGSLEEGGRDFRIVHVSNMEGLYGETDLLPPVEGITTEISCGDWSPSFDIDLDDLEDEDYLYWELFATTPKAFISLDDAREMWSTPWGDTTSLLFTEDPVDNFSEISMEAAGISIIRVRDNAVSSSRAMAIFPGMFLTFGSVIMVSTALVMVAVLKDISLRRSRDWGTLRSIGFDRFRLFLFGMYDNIPAVFSGSILGILLGYVISFLIGFALRNIWSASVEGATVPFIILPASIIVSVSSGILLSFAVIGWVIGKTARSQIASNSREEGTFGSILSSGYLLIIGSLLLPIGILLLWLMSSDNDGTTYAVAGPFILGTVIVTIAVACLFLYPVTRVVKWNDRALFISANLSRRPGQTRSGVIFLSIVLSLAISLSGFGALLEGNISSNIGSYGGGFDIIMETELALDGSDVEPELKGFDIHPLLTLGDEGGKCSNINAVYPPRLVGLSEETISICSFDVDSGGGDTVSVSYAFNRSNGSKDQRIPILVDENTLRWIYFGDIGTVFEIERGPGDVVEFEVIGILSPSVLSGTFVMIEDDLKRSFPASSGYDLFLINGETDDEDIDLLELHFSSLGPEVIRTEDLAMEDLEFELSYLGLFRDFILFGVFTSMVAMIVFDHTRTTRFRRETSILRSIGVTKDRAMSYILRENLLILMGTLLVSTVGSAITISLTSGLFTGTPQILFLFRSTVPIILVLSILSIVSSLISARWSVKDYEKMIPAYDA